MTGNQSGCLIDRADFELLANQAKHARMQFIRKGFRFFFLGCGSVGLFCVLAITLLSAASTDRNYELGTNRQLERTLEATAQMEKFTEMLRQVTRISPNAGREIEQLIRQPQYDCSQVACDAALETRNRFIRSKLVALLARITLPDENTRSGEYSIEMARSNMRSK